MHTTYIQFVHIFSDYTILFPNIYIIFLVPIQSLHRVYIKDENLRKQPKFIVFLSQLLLLFQFCHPCKADNPLVETTQAMEFVGFNNCMGYLLGCGLMISTLITDRHASI